MADPVQVRAEATPNPNSMKFTVNRELWAGRARTVSSQDEALGLPLAVRLLAVPGVRSLFFLRDFVTVTRDPGANWEALVPAVIATIEAHYAEG
ncbi:MAG: NifU N-terminal domain-containing protein [Chloroflexi bacterium]|jgi:hypothetical protein|nr:NifU N-terminal domain-containing protein [Chloroflexota bacterium]